jgi:hypothetical protein
MVRIGSTDLDPYQNITDPEHCAMITMFLVKFEEVPGTIIRGFFGKKILDVFKTGIVFKHF